VACHTLFYLFQHRYVTGMKYITTNVLGVFVVEDGEVQDWHAFGDDPETIASKLEGGCPKADELADEHNVMERRQMDAHKLGTQVDAIDSRNDLYQLQHRVAQAFTRQKIEEGHDRDQLLVQATRALDDLDQITNELIERLRPWYGIYFPEIEDRVDDHREFASMVAEQFERDELDGFEDLAAKSTGMELRDADEQMIREFARRVRDTHETRASIESYVEDLAERIAPNVSAILGKLLTARMISQAGSLEELSRMPSSTIQVLGAEKALFRHMRGEGSAPKHGILYMHPMVRNLPDDKRGKMARFIANKTSIASRLDQFGGDFKGDELNREVEEKYEEVKG